MLAQKKGIVKRLTQLFLFAGKSLHLPADNFLTIGGDPF